jgi:hypothetical protein
MQTGNRTVACARWCPPGRRLHLIDADNLAGSGYPSTAQVREVHDAYGAAVRPGPLDHTIIACSHMSGVDVGLEWQGAQLFWRSGPDGADLVLLDALDRIDDIASRFAGVVVGSGDGIFSYAADSIRAAGIPVVVAWGRGRLAYRLERAASGTVAIFSARVTARSAGGHASPSRPRIAARPGDAGTGSVGRRTYASSIAP